MESGMAIDFTEFNYATNRVLKMGEVKKSEITKVFRDADKTVLRTAKSLITSKNGFRPTSIQYPSRNHNAGFLKRKIKFSRSRKYKLVYYVLSPAWYSAIYATGHGTWRGNKFIERAWNATQGGVVREIETGISRLTERIWKNG